MTKYKDYNKYEVTFTPKTKYNQMTRSVNVYALNDYHARLLVHTQFGSFAKNKEAGAMLQRVPSDKIKIESVKEIKDEVAELVNV